MRGTTKIFIAALAFIALTFYFSFHYNARRPSLSIEPEQPEDDTLPPLAPQHDAVVLVSPQRSPQWRAKYAEYALNASSAPPLPKLMPALDTLPYFLRSLDAATRGKSALKLRRIFLIVPDVSDMGSTILRSVDTGSLRVVPHRAFVPIDTLPTFNRHAVLAALKNIDLSDDFLVFDYRHILLRPLTLAQFRAVDRQPALHRLPMADASMEGVNGDDEVDDQIEHVARRNTRAVAGSSLPVDATAPALINRELFLAALAAHAKEVVKTTRERFVAVDDIDPIELYYQYIARRSRSLTSPAEALRLVDRNGDGALDTEHELRLLADLLRWPLDDVRAAVPSDTTRTIAAYLANERLRDAVAERLQPNENQSERTLAIEHAFSSAQTVHMRGHDDIRAMLEQVVVDSGATRALVLHESLLRNARARVPLPGWIDRQFPRQSPWERASTVAQSVNNVGALIAFTFSVLIPLALYFFTRAMGALPRQAVYKAGL